MNPKLKSIDHIHIFVDDRQEALKWYKTVLGLKPVKNLLFWAKTGPLTIGNEDGSVHIALFKGEPNENRSVVAFNTSGKEFIKWHKKIKCVVDGRIKVVDHSVSFSIYFKDPYGNPFEITSYDYELLKGYYK